MDTLVVRDDRWLAHDPGAGHPERAERLSAVHEDLDARPIAGTTTEAATSVDPADLLLVHSAAHLERMAATAGLAHVQLDPDTATGPRSHEAALLAAGAVVSATEAVVAGSRRGAFALVRPPGHHAEAEAAMGFCLFNNVAVAAARATASWGCRRVLVLDPDVHHGNGTQRIFWDRRDVLYVSSHRFPFYPGTGWFDELGEGDGEGFTVNLPLPPASGDADFDRVYREVVAPIVDEFAPDLILVSAGFDTWHRDPLGGMRMTPAGYRALSTLFVGWADRHCPGRIVFALEGGYDPSGVAAGVRAALEAMTGSPPAAPALPSPGLTAEAIVAKARRTLAPYWASLRR